MSKNENVASSEISKSKQKRIDRKKKNEHVKREGLFGAIIGILAIALILGAIVFSIVTAAIKQAAVVEPNGEYGTYLTDAGMVEKIKASSIVTLPSDYLSISVPKSEVEYTEDMFAEEMEKQLNNHKVLDTETDKAVESGDTINLDYVGSVDGVEFEGGSTDGAGTDLEIGSGTYIPGFEDQIIGHKVSENFDINVTFPDDYAKAELAGKDAVFNITVNGIYTLSQFTDSFVAENLKATGCKSVTEYRKYLEDSYYKSQLDQYITNYINENSSVSKYPSKYLKQLMALKMYSDQSSYEYMNQLYINYSGQGFSSFEEYTGMSQEDYQASVDEAAKNECTSILAHQAIAENNNISVSDDDIKAYIEEMYGEGSYDTTLESYGKPYLAQEALQNKVHELLVENATVK